MIIIINGIGVGVLLICHYIVWISTKTWLDFAYYVLIMNSIGILIGVPAGLATGKAILKRRKERKRLQRLSELCDGKRTKKD